MLDAGLNAFLVLAPIFFEELRRHRVGRGVRVGVAQQRLDRRQNGRHVVRRTPSGGKNWIQIINLWFLRSKFKIKQLKNDMKFVIVADLHQEWSF